MRSKIRIQKRGGKKQKIKIRYLGLILAVIISGSSVHLSVSAESCPDLRVVFARGSGGELNRDPNYLEFKSTIEAKLSGTTLNYEFIDLDYPAVGVGLDNLKVTAGAYFGAGESYEFGESVKSGVKKLDKLVNGSACPNTKYVLGGYSQGAMVVSKTLPDLKPERLIYAATFGDPKIYLPEGKGIVPEACSGKNLSDYRTYVPDCHAYKGLLGAYIPYEPEALVGEVGTWCDKNDVFCSSHFNLDDHLSYIADNLYEDASRFIFNKVVEAFGLDNRVLSPHDTAIVIDSTGSMRELIEEYKTEALRLAKETLDSGGRVALYDYRDLDDPYQPVKRCDFETCTIDTFINGLDEIAPYGGGDDNESLLSATFHVMQELNWQWGATKSLVVLTDAGFLSPDRDGISYADAVNLSKTIDPVNFYIVTEPWNEELYQDLAADTDGMVVTTPGSFSLLTDYIIERYDSLPKVEESNLPQEAPVLEIVESWEHDASIELTLSGTWEQVLVIVNDKILGITDQRNITIGDLDENVLSHLLLVPIANGIRGEGVEMAVEMTTETTVEPSSTELPKAPNTGKSTKEGASAIISRFAPLAAFVVVLLVVLAVGIVVSKQHKED